MTITQEKFDTAVTEAIKEANVSTALKYQGQYLKMIDSCGFGWVTIMADGRSAMGKILKNNSDFDKSYEPKKWTLWCPVPSQNICIKEYWSQQVRDKLIENGITATVGSRLD